MIIARILSKADFGIAAAFGMVMTILEFSGRLAIARFIVQDKEGDRPEFVATAHSIQFIASASSSICMLLLAVPAARLFGVVGHESAFMLLAFMPLIRGMENLDVSRMERDLRFLPSSLVYIAPQVLMTALSWPIAAWLPDYRAILVLLAIKGIGSVIMTQVLAERPFRWGLNRTYAMRMLKFGWPLLLNGFLLFGVYQGDQFLVGSFYSMADLGTYAAAATLAMAPSIIFARILSSLMLPLMAKVQDDAVKFRSRYGLCIQAVAAFSACYAVTTIVASPGWMRLAYGKKYSDGAIILAWLAASNAYRIIRIAPAIAALSKADSHNQLFSNLFRVVSLVPAALLGWAKQPLWALAAAGLCGEAFACLFSLWRLKRRDDTPWSISLGPIALATLGIAIAGIGGFFRKGIPIYLQVPFALLLGLGTGFGYVLSFPSLRRQFFAYVLDVHSRFIGTPRGIRPV